MFYVHGYTLDVVCVVCICCSRVLYTVIYIQPSWQSCTSEAAPRAWRKGGVHVRGGRMDSTSVKLVLNFSKAATITNVINS